MFLNPDLSGLRIQIVPIYRDPRYAGLSIILIEIVGKVWYNSFGFRGGIAHRRKAMSSTAHAMGHESRKANSMKTYKFKMYSNHGNRELQKTIAAHTAVWNHFVALCRRYYAIYGKYPGKKVLMRHLTKLKRVSRYAHWNLLPSQSLQDIIDRLDKAYSKLFANGTSGKRSGRPRFKRRTHYKSFTLKQAGWKLLQENYIRIGKRIYRYFKSREVLGNPKRCTIKRDSVGDVWLIILTDHVDMDLESPTTGNNAGFDFGLKTYLTGADYNDYASPQFFKRGLNTIKRAYRKHSRKVKGSNNRERASTLARKHRQIANQRQDFHWKLAHDLTDRYDWISLETLNLTGMKSLWGRKVSDLGFSDFVQKLKYIASKKLNREIRFINRWYPSSKTCHACGAVNQALNLRDRTWQCPSCHTQLDRDRNAALNIHRVGASTLEGEDVSGGSPSNPC